MTFRRLGGPTRAPEVSFEFEGRTVVAREGDSVATALLASGILQSRTAAVSGSARAPFCLIGACFECLMEIDGQANRQACLAPVREGMTVARQTAVVEPEAER